MRRLTVQRMSRQPEGRWRAAGLQRMATDAAPLGRTRSVCPSGKAHRWQWSAAELPSGAARC